MYKSPKNILLKKHIYIYKFNYLHFIKFDIFMFILDLQHICIYKYIYTTIQKFEVLSL